MSVKILGDGSQSPQKSTSKRENSHCPQVWKAIKPVLPLVTSGTPSEEPGKRITRKEELRRATLIDKHSQLFKT